MRALTTRLFALPRFCFAAKFAVILSACIATLAGATDVPLREVIDKEVRSACEKEAIPLAPKSDDATFLRRVYLDLVGTIPTRDRKPDKPLYGTNGIAALSFSAVEIEAAAK